MSSRETPSQTVGPYFAIGLTAEQYSLPFSSVAGHDLITPDTIGAPIIISGQVFDGEGTPVNDAMIEIWQADAAGRYPNRTANTAFSGFGRAGTGSHDDNRFEFRTVKPGAVADGEAPHINIVVFMRGALNHLFTRMYFPKDAAAHAMDPVLTAVPAERRHTLIARSDGEAAYRFDIHMQGAQETVFFDL